MTVLIIANPPAFVEDVMCRCKFENVESAPHVEVSLQSLFIGAPVSLSLSELCVQMETAPGGEEMPT